MVIDFNIEHHGSLSLVRPLTDDARAWLQDVTDGLWFGGALAVEPRYLDALIDGAVNEGFTVAGGF